MPKSFFGPAELSSVIGNQLVSRDRTHTTGIVTGREQYTTRSLSLPDDVTSSWCAQYTILPDQQLLDSVCSTNLGDQLHHFRVVVSSISSYNKEATFCTFRDGEDDAGDERLAVVRLLEDGDLLSKS